MTGLDALGSPDWLQSTGGILTFKQRMRLAGRIYRELPLHLTHRVRSSLWRVLPSRGEVDHALGNRPDSVFSRKAEEVCLDLLGKPFFNHSIRAWIFGTALARRDDVELEPELFYVAAMLHDVGLGKGTYGCCFTYAGVEWTRSIGLKLHQPDENLELIASAISHHITPGLRVAEGGVHGVYLQRGTVLDLVGTRAVHLPKDFVCDTFVSYPALGIKTEGSSRWRAESALVRHGRAHHLQRWSRFSTLARLSPLPPRC